MSQAYAGNYTSNLYNPSKRYRLNTGGSSYIPGGFCKSVPLSDSELREIGDVSDSFIKQLVSANFPRGSSINNGFQVVQSSSDTANNFTIKGGDGTVNGAGILFVDGIIAFLKSDIEYKNQDATGALTDDDYTKTSIPTLTTPVGSRTDVVYLDLFFSEVSASAGSEYQDTSLIVSGIGSATANRVRQVQDIRVAEGGSVPADGNDGNGIYHRYVQIATLARTASANILTSMITDNRIKINSVNSLSQGTTITDILTSNGQNIGNDTHRIGQIFMASTIDYKTNDLMFKNNGTETVRITTGGNVGIGSSAPTKPLVISDGTVNFAVDHTATGGEIGTDSNHPLMIKANGAEAVRLLANGRVGIGTTNPQAVFHVNGDALISNNLTVNGVTTTVNTEVTTTDMMTINQDDNQVAFAVNQTVGGNSATVMTISNAGTGYALTIDQGNVGIGSTSPVQLIDMNGTDANLKQTSTGASNTTYHIMGSKRAGAENTVLNYLLFQSNAVATNNVAGITVQQGPDTTNRDDAHMVFFTAESSSPGIVERMRIAANGLIGINTSSPQDNLHIHSGSGAPTIRISANSVAGGQYGGFDFRDADGVLNRGGIRLYANVGDATSSNLRFYTNASGVTSSEKMRIASDGKVGIGSTSPNHRLDVMGVTGADTWIRSSCIDANSSSGILLGRSGAQDRWYIKNAGAAESDKLYIVSNSGNGVVIQQGGNVGIGTTSPEAILHIKSSAPQFVIHDMQTPALGTGPGLYLGGRFNTASNSTAEFALISGIKEKVTDNNYDGALVFSTRLSGLNERMRITSDGKVGIGAASPACKLNVQNDVDDPGDIFRLTNVSALTSAATRMAFATSSSVGAATFIQYGGGHSTKANMLEIGTQVSGSIQLITGGNDRMRIGANGNVGLGTTDTSTRLRVYTNDASNWAQVVSNISTSGEGLLIMAGNNPGTGSAQLLECRDNAGNVKFNVWDAGRVGLGTTSPDTKLHLFEASADSSIKVHTNSNSTNAFCRYMNSYSSLVIGQTSNAGGALLSGVPALAAVINMESNYGLYFGTNGTIRMFISNGGTVTVNSLSGSGNRTVYSDSAGALTNSSSDRSMKQNIVDSAYGLQQTLALRPVSFNWKTELQSKLGAQNEIGLIAQEVQPIIPEVVGTNSDGTLSLDYAKLVPVLINAIKELKAELDALKASLL